MSVGIVSQTAQNRFRYSSKYLTILVIKFFEFIELLDFMPIPSRKLWNKLQVQVKIDLFSIKNCCQYFLFALFHLGIRASSAATVLVLFFLCER